MNNETQSHQLLKLKMLSLLKRKLLAKLKKSQNLKQLKKGYQQKVLCDQKQRVAKKSHMENKTNNKFMEIKETFETLWEYCVVNNRLCPNPQKWNELYGMLKNTKQNPDGGWTPSIPLILFAWDISMPIEKQLRFKEHIQWAADNNQIEEVGKYLRLLSEKDWTHFGEI